MPCSLGDSLLGSGMIILMKFLLLRLKFLLLTLKYTNPLTAAINGTKRTTANDTAQTLESGLGGLPGWTKEKSVCHSHSCVQCYQPLPFFWNCCDLLLVKL